MLLKSLVPREVVVAGCPSEDLNNEHNITSILEKQGKLCIFFSSSYTVKFE